MSFPTPRAQRVALLCVVSSVLGVSHPAAAAATWLGLGLVTCLLLIDLRAARAAHVPSLQRSLPRRARLGEPCTFRYTLQSAFECEVLDELPAALGGDARLGPVRPSASEAVILEREVRPSLRGTHALGPTYLFVRSPLGLFVRRYRFDLRESLRVYPAEPAAQPRALGGRKLWQELGLRPRRPRGAGAEFESLREYGEGDEPRHIDWRASARARKVIVRNYHVERNHTVVLALDCGRLMGAFVDQATKLDHALSACISLVQACAQSGDRVGFMAFDRELRAFVPPQRGAAALGLVLESSLSLAPCPYEPSYRVLAEVLQERQKKRALIVVLTDFVEAGSTPELEAYVATLARRHCVLLVGVRDRLLREVEQAAPAVSGVDVYRRLVLRDLDEARGAAFARLARLGVQALDLDPAQISAPLLDRYLEIREVGLL